MAGDLQNNYDTSVFDNVSMTPVALEGDVDTA